MNRWLVGTLSLALTAPALAAQDKGTPSSGRERAERRAEEMREGLGTVKQIKSHVRVQVRLANGNRLKGVVKDGKLVERVDGLRFVDADARDRGAGIRLWYSGGTRNYVFVPFKDLAEYEILERLSAKELVAIESEMRMEEARRNEIQRQQEMLRRQQEKAAAAGPAGEAEPPGGPGATPQPGGDAGTEKTEKTEKTEQAKAKEAAESAEQQKQRAMFQLLKDYPPQQGWNAAKRDEIKRKFAVLGVKPTESEQRFVDNFELWDEARKFFGLETTPAKEGGEDEAGGSGKRSRRGKK